MKGFDPKFRDFPDYILGVTPHAPRLKRITFRPYDYLR